MIKRSALCLITLILLYSACYAVTNNITAEGRLDVSNSISGSEIYLTGNSTASAYFGNGSNLSGITVSTANYSLLSGNSTNAATSNYALLSGNASNAANASNANYALLSGNASNAANANYAILSGSATSAAGLAAGGFANPTALTGLATVNGSATTAMRSDAAPALSQSITPTWTGAHTWSALGTFSLGLNASGAAVSLNASSNFNTNINTGTSTGVVAIGSTTGAAGITESVGTGNFSLDGVAGSTYNVGASTTSGTITIGGTSETGAITVGASTGTQTLNLGTGAGLSTVNIANGLVGNQVAIANGANTVAQAINIGSGANAANNTINIGAGTNTAGVVAITLGTNTNFANTTAIKGGNGTGAISMTPQTTGTIVIGAPAGTGTISVGASSAAQILNLGTGAGLATVNIASGLVGSAVNIANGANTVAQTVNIAAGANAANNTINIGSGTNTAGITAITLGSTAARANTLTLENGTGAITFGNSANARTWNVGAGNAIQTVNMFNNATPANVLSIGGAASTTTIGSIKNTIGIAGVANGNGVRIGNGRFVVNKPVAAVAAAGSIVATVTQVLDSGIFVFTPGAAAGLQLPTAQGATGLVQALPGTPAVGDVFTFLIVNTTANAVTLEAGAGTTLVDNPPLQNDFKSRVVYCRVTGVGAGAETLSVY